MKTKKYIIAVALMSVSIFMGCNKESSLEDNLTGSTANAKIADAAPLANVTYQLQILLPPAGALVKWENGYISTTEIIFNNANSSRQMVDQLQFTTNESKTFNLFSTPVLGSVEVPYGTFSNASLALQLNIVNIPPLTTAPAPYTTQYQHNTIGALGLNGVFDVINKTTASFQQMPVQVVIDQSVTINSVALNNTVINQPGYLALLDLDLSQITNGMDATMLQNATQTNGTILITSSSNPNLYAIIVNNLQTNLINAQFSAQPLPVLPVANQIGAIPASAKE